MRRQRAIRTKQNQSARPDNHADPTRTTEPLPSHADGQHTRTFDEHRCDQCALRLGDRVPATVDEAYPIRPANTSPDPAEPPHGRPFDPVMRSRRSNDRLTIRTSQALTNCSP
jgi:hypothetical protein